MRKQAMTGSQSVSRRRFLKGSLATAGTTLAIPSILPSSVWGSEGKVSPSNRITVGMIGVGRQAVHSNLKAFLEAPDVQVVALCDVDTWRLERAAEQVTTKYGSEKRSGTSGEIPCYADFRELLARDDLDAVMISTPDHWHVPMSVAAVRAGKDVCCEKPLTRSIAEGRLLSDEVTKHQRVFRTDSEFRSLATFHRMCELVRNGRIGEIERIVSGVPIDQFTSPEHVEMPVPEELDYEIWTGPAPMVPYTESRVQPRKGYTRPGWMRVRDYCDGMVTNWGAHLNDIAQWGNNTDRTGPVEVEGQGKYPPEGSMWNVLVEFEVHYRYANGVRLIYKTEKPFVRFEGTEGWIQVDYPKGLQAEPESVLKSEIGPDEIHLPLVGEKRDFINCVKSRGTTLEDAEVGHRTTSLCHLAEIAVQVGQKLEWDPVTERFLQNESANLLVSKTPGREPWTL